VRDHGRRPFVAVQDAEDLIALTRDIADKVLDPSSTRMRKAETYPEGVFSQFGRGGVAQLAAARGVGWRRPALRGLFAGARGIAARWAAVAVGVSVHSLSSHPLLTFGNDEQKRRWCRDAVG